MTLINQNSSVTHNGNGVTTLWPYTFIIPDAASARVGLFDVATGVLTEITDTDYSITGLNDAAGGEVTYPLIGSPITSAKRLVIWREVEYTQDTELTNQTPYYPSILEAQLDRIVMQVQQLAADADRSIKVTLGSDLTPDEFIEDLQLAEAAAEASAATAVASAASASASASQAAASAASVDASNIVHVLPEIFTAAQQGQARANIGADVLGGFRNKFINGDFDIWQRATSHTTSGYGSADRWASFQVGSTKTMSRQAFALGQTDVPGGPEYFCRTVVSSVAGAGNLVNLAQAIEDVRTLAGKKATLTFYAKADASKNVSVLIQQYFGTGGSPSATLNVHTGLKALTTAWQKFTVVVDIPSISGKTLGSNNNDCLYIALYFDAGASISAAPGLGQQSGTFDIAHVSIVEGDATAEADPFSPRHIQQELALCQRYYETSNGGGLPFASSDRYVVIPTATTSYPVTTFRVGKRVVPTFTTVFASGTGASFQVGLGAFYQDVNHSGPSTFGWGADAEL